MDVAAEILQTHVPVTGPMAIYVGLARSIPLCVYVNSVRTDFQQENLTLQDRKVCICTHASQTTCLLQSWFNTLWKKNLKPSLAVELRHCTRLKEVNLDSNRIPSLVLGC